MLSLMKPGAAATVTGLLVFTITGADTAHQSRISPAAQEVHLRNIRQLTFEGVRTPKPTSPSTEPG